MTLRLRFQDPTTDALIADTYAGDARLRIALNESGSWSATIAANQRAVQEIERGNTVQIYWNGILYLTGTVKEFARKFDEQTTIAIQGHDVLDNLFRKRANSMAQWRTRQNVLQLIEELLRTETSDWTLGNIESFYDQAAVKKLDLRDSERLMEQIKKAVEDMPDTYFRYGGYEEGYHQLDIGSFGRDSGISILTASDPEFSGNDDQVGEIVSLQETTKLTEIFIACEARGGQFTNSSGREIIIHLGHAYDDDSSIVHDANFPLRETMGDERWTVYNKVLSEGPGGMVGAHIGRSTLNGSATNLQVGETHVSATDYDGVLLKFTPVPGILREILVWSYDGDANWPFTDGTHVRASLCEAVEITPGMDDWEPAAADPIAEVDFLPHIGSADPTGFSITSITFDEEIILEWDKDYCVVLQPTSGATGNLIYWSPASDSRIPSRTFVSRAIDLTNTLPRTDMTDLGIYLANRDCPMMAVITDPIETVIYEEVTKQWQQYAPETDDDDPPSAGEIDDAAITAYERTAAFLLDHSESRKTYTLSAIGENILPQPGETIYVKGQAEGAFVDPFTGREEIFRTEVATDLVVDSLDITFRGDRLNVNFGLREGAGLQAEDLFVSVYDKTKNSNKGKKTRVNDPWYTRRDLETLSTSISATVPTEEMSDGRAAVKVTLTPTVPEHRAQFLTIGKPYVTGGATANMDIEWISRPTYQIKRSPATAAEADMEQVTPYEIKMAPVGRNWDASDTADLEALVLWR